MSSKLCVAAFAAVSVVASADTLVRTRYSTGSGEPGETKVLTKGSRQRVDTGKQVSMVQQGDLKQFIQINNQARTYLVVSTKSPSPVKGSTGTTRHGAVVNVATDVADTGERKQLLGMQARHLKVTMTRLPETGACDATKTRMELDGWYVDFEAPAPKGSKQDDAGKPECEDDVLYEQTGAGKLGYPVAYTARTWIGEDKNPTVVTMEVLELSHAPLDAALFDVPAGYRGVKTPQELDAKPDAVRLALVSANDRTGKFNSGTVNTRMMGLLKNDNLVTIPMSPGTDIEAQAKAANCDFILYTEVAELKKPLATTKIGGMLSKGLSKMAPSTANASEARVDFRLVPTGETAPRIAASETGKAGGGLTLTSAIELASNASVMGLMARTLMNPAMMGMMNPQLMNAMMAGGTGSGPGAGSPLASLDPGMNGIFSMLSHSNRALVNIQSTGTSISGGFGSVTATPQETGALNTALSKTVLAELVKK
jgi:hypothetical protein